MKQSAAQAKFLLVQATALLAALDDSHRAAEPAAGMKTAGWLIGHLAVTGDFARRLCGQQPICPVEWRTMFNPGSFPSTNPDDYPPMATLRDTFFAVYTDLSDAAPKADPKSLAVQNPFGPGRAAFPTAGDFVGYLLTGHLAYHLGQLVAWRTAAGLSRVPHPADIALS